MSIPSTKTRSKATATRPPLPRLRKKADSNGSSGIESPWPLVIPPFAHDLEGFRNWSYDAHFPETGDISYLAGEIFIDMSPERIGRTTSSRASSTASYYRSLTRKTSADSSRIGHDSSMSRPRSRLNPMDGSHAGRGSCPARCALSRPRTATTPSNSKERPIVPWRSSVQPRYARTRSPFRTDTTKPVSPNTG